MWWLCATTPQIMIIGANSILLLRIHALYGRNRKLLIALLFCVGVELGLEFYAGIKAAILATRNIIEAPAGIPLSGCLIVSNPFTFQFTLFAWIPCIFNALTFFLLTAYKFYEKVIAESQDSWRSLGRKDISPVLIAFVRDGTIFFFLFMVVIVVNTIISLKAPGALQSAGLPPLFATFSYLGSHLVLNLREVANASSRKLMRETEWSTRAHFNVASGSSTAA